ncbi:MAG: Maf family protein [Treponema sp.]
MYTLILASSSQNRKEILSSINIPFIIEEPICNEQEIKDDSSIILTQKRAIAKMECVSKKHKNEKTIVIGADTVIDISGCIFGKPKTKEEAKDMIMSYSGASHLVISSIALINTYTQKTYKTTSISRVYFKNIEEWEIDAYLKTNDWQGVAGGYKVQGLAKLFIEKIEGSYSGIVGFPICEFYSSLKLLCDDAFSLIFKPNT